MVKSLLLDQSIICGLGNIYIDEILWASKIHPAKKSNSINKIQSNMLHMKIINILNQSIKYHGTTIINFKFDNMRTGLYKNKLNVYARNNKLCKLCKNKIIKIRISGRGTHLCSYCQR